MIEKLVEINHRFEEVGQLLGQPEVVKDMKKFTQLSKEYRDLEKVVINYRRYRQILDGLEHAKEVLETEKDAELRGWQRWNWRNWPQSATKSSRK